MAARALPNPARGVPGLVVLPAGGYRRVRAELLLRPKEPPALVTHELPGLGAVRVMRTAGFEARAGGYVALGLLAAELSRRGVAAGLAELDAGLHAGAVRSVGLSCAGSPAFVRGAGEAALRAGVEVLLPLGADAALVAADRSRPGLTEPPRQAMQALRLATDAALDAWTGDWTGDGGEPPPTHVLVGADRAALAAAASVQLRARLTPAPALLLTASAAAGASAATQDRLGPLAWQELERGMAGLLLAGDGRPLAALAAACTAARATLGLGPDSRVLVLDAETSP